MDIMLCGARDTTTLLSSFRKIAAEMRFNPLNYADGTITYHNTGENKWDVNSRMTVQDAEVLVFVILGSVGSITWNVEYDEALKNGKNFIVLCAATTYGQYQTIKDSFSRIPIETLEPIRVMLHLLNKLEYEHQLTIVPFELPDFENKLKEQLMKLFKQGMRITERDNRRNMVRRILDAGKYGRKLDYSPGSIEEKIAKEMLFDVFEPKERRKRALDYFTMTKSLSEDEIIELCGNMEQGVARKAFACLSELVSPGQDVAKILYQIIESCTEDDVGIIRRAIKSFFATDLHIAIPVMKALFPCQDVGTPRRIVNEINLRRKELIHAVSDYPALKQASIELLQLCRDSQNIKNWKELAEEILKELKTT